MEASRGRGEGGCAAVFKKPSAHSGETSSFGGHPRFSGARQGAYAELFGGLIASCSIPFLDLPPAGDGFDEPPAGSKRRGFDYSEVFGGLDFGEFAATYEELLAESKTEATVGASERRVPKESNLQQQATELQLERTNGNHIPCPEDDQLPLTSNHSDGDSKHLNPSYNKAPKESNLWEQATEAVELPLEHPNGNHVACSEDQLSSNSYSSDGASKHLNSSHNELSSGFKDYAISGIIEPHAVQGFNSILLESKPLNTEKGGNFHCVHEEINDEKQQDKSFITYSSDGSRISSDDVTTEWKQTRSQYLFSENDHANMKHESRPSSSHLESSGNTSSYDITYVSVSEINLQTRPSLMPPPSRPPPKMFNKQVHPIVKVHTMSDQLEGGICKLVLNHEKHVDQEMVKESSPFSSDVDSSAAVSAIAMKETMQLAQGRLQSKKEMIERKCDSFHSKKMDHSANAKHEEMVVDQASGRTEILSQILIKENMVNELKQSGTNLREESTGKISVDTNPNLKKIEHVVLPGEDEQMMALNSLESTNLGSQVEKESEKLKVNHDRVEMEPKKWKVNKEYYELTHTEKKLNKVSEIPEQEAFRNSIHQTLRLSEENKRENSEVAEVLKFDNNIQWNSANEGNQKEEDAESMSNDAINFIEKRVGVTPEQEAFREKIKQTLKLSEANKRENSEAAEVLEFVNNTQWNNANEENQKEDNPESMSNDDINFVEKRVGVTSENSEAAEVLEFVNNTQWNNANEENQKEENPESMSNDAINFVEKRVALTSEKETFRNKVKQTLNLSEENKRENLEAAEVLEFGSDNQWNSGNEGSPNQENVKSMRYNAVSFVEKRVGITSEQEAFMNKIKQTELSEENKKENLEVAKILEFENNTQLRNADEGSRKKENVGSMRTDAINFVEKEVGVTPDMVSEALVNNNVINLEETRADHGEQNKIEEVQGVPGEGVNVPHTGECSSAFIEKRELANDSVTPLNHGSLHLEEKSQDAKEIFECGQHSYAFKSIHNDEVDELKSKTARDEHIVSDDTCSPYEVEETSDSTPRTPVLDENEYVELIEGDDTEETYAYRDSEKAVREEQAKSNQAENEILRENIDAAREEEDNKHMKQESCMMVENDSRFEIDQEQNYLEEVYKKLKAAQEAAMSEEPEKLVKATKNTWQEENNAKGTQVEGQGNDRKQQSTQVPQTLGTSKEPSASLNSNDVTKDKDAEEVLLKPDVFGKSPSLNTPQEFFPRPPNTDFNVQQANLLGRRTNIVDSIQDGIQRQHMASEKRTQINKVEDSELLQKEKEQADEHAKELEEKEREREKDRVAVERATRETHERALADARERAQRIAVERVTAEARRRAIKEAREKAEFEKVTKEARLRAERAAVERATTEARERAAERARAEMAAADAKDRAERFNNTFKDRNGSHITQFQKAGMNFQGYSVSGEGESALRCKARLERHQRTAERAAKALAEKNRRDILAQREQAERDRLAEYLNVEVKRWSTGKEGNLRALLSTLQYILGTESGWQPIHMQEVVTAAAVKKAYRKATLFVHPDKLQQRGASIQQKYICEKVFDLLKEAWNRFNSEERW